MEILFFLIPKSQVEYVFDNFSIRQTAEKLKFHGYRMIPVLSKDGKYVGSVSDGDIFWFLKEKIDNGNYENYEKTSISDVPKGRKIEAVKYSASMEDLLSYAVSQNYVPVVDDNGIFMGIITRRAIIEYLSKK